MLQRYVNSRINYGSYWKEFDSHFSVRRSCKDCHLIAHMAFFSIKYLVLKWNYFFLSGNNSFRRVLQPLYEATWLQSRTGSGWGVPPWLKGFVTICVVTKLSVLFWFWFRNPKSKRNEVEEILDNLLFSYWVLVVGTIISNSNLTASWQFDVKSWRETTRSWKAAIYRLD